MDGLSRLEVDHNVESYVGDWSTYLSRLIDQESLVSSGTRMKALYLNSNVYHLSQFVAVVEAFFKAVRVYLIALNKQAVLANFEARVGIALNDLNQNLLAQPASVRCQYAIKTLARALAEISFTWIKSHSLFQERLHIADLAAGLRRLENLGITPVSIQRFAPVIQTVSTSRVVPTVASGAAEPYRSVAALTPPNPGSRSILFPRYAVGAAFASAVIGYSWYKEPPVAISASEPASYELHDRGRERRNSTLINHEIEFFRHTVDIVDPVKPHTSVVVPTLEEVFTRRSGELTRCYADNNPLNVHSANELAHYIADHHRRDAHNLVQRVARRRSNRTITIWWTENCHEIVIAPGVQTTFSADIRPSPVTILFTPPIR